MLSSPFDLAEVEVEQAPRGGVTLEGWRGREPLSLTLGPRGWGLAVRPPLPEDVGSLYESGLRASSEARFSAWRHAVDRARSRGDASLACWLLVRIGRAHHGERRFDLAAAAYREAADRAPAPRLTERRAAGGQVQPGPDRAEPGRSGRRRREGLVGLTRAFQYAGARSVLASLWGVADESTADLMGRFYGELRKGRSKDEALRRAQVGVIRSRQWSHPFHWAAFQLHGDWR